MKTIASCQVVSFQAALITLQRKARKATGANGFGAVACFNKEEKKDSMVVLNRIGLLVGIDRERLF